MKTSNRISDFEEAVSLLEKAAEKIVGPIKSARHYIPTKLDVDAAARLVADAVVALEDHLGELRAAYAIYLCAKAQGWLVFWMSDFYGKWTIKSKKEDRLDEHLSEAFDCMIKASTTLISEA